MTYFTDNITVNHDNFSFQAWDNVSFNRSRPATVQIDVINPSPAYNVDNFTAIFAYYFDHHSLGSLSDNGSEIRKVICCYAAITRVCCFSMDNQSYDNDTICGDGNGRVNLTANSDNFTWHGLPAYQEFFQIYSFTTKGTYTSLQLPRQFQ